MDTHADSCVTSQYTIPDAMQKKKPVGMSAVHVLNKNAPKIFKSRLLEDREEKGGD